jgi:uncharacterized protein
VNVLIDAGHPAHVHYYRRLAAGLEGLGHRVFWSVKDIPVAKRLLDAYGFRYTVWPRKSDRLPVKAAGQLMYDLMMLRFCRRNRIDLAIGTSVSVAHVSAVSRVRSILFDDDDDAVQPLVTRFAHPFADVLLSPDCLAGRRKRRDTVYYPGYHELAYLHPRRFTPDPSALEAAGLARGDRFFLLRFNAFKAHHDAGVRGLSLGQKRTLIGLLETRGPVRITAEREIEPELRRFALNIGPERIHSLMAFAALFIGDSQTMASEAAVLGVPSLRCNSFAGRIAYLEEQERRYGLTAGFAPERFDALMGRVTELLAKPDLGEEWARRRRRMLEDKIDVTGFWIWFVDGYPDSVETVRNDPGIFGRFR